MTTESDSMPVARVELTESAVFVNEIEAARILGGVAPRTMQRWRIEGSGPPFYKFGHAIRYRLPDLLAHAETRRRTSTSDSPRAA